MRHRGAGLAIPDFPLAFGRVIPPLSDSAVVLHFAHRVGALAVLAAVAVLAFRAHRSGVTALARLASVVVLLVLAQISLGATTVLTGKAVLPTTAHVAVGAAVLGSCWLLLLRAWRRLRPRAETAATLDRALRIFGDVRPGEGGTVLLMCLNVALLLVAYYVLKTVREPLILLSGGAELKSYAAAAQALTLIVYVPIYGWLAQRLPRQRFLAAVILFFVACIELFVLGGHLGVPHLGFAFYVWVGIFSLTTIAQFWSFANELYTRTEGDRLFPLIAVGATAGAPIGAAVAGRLFGSGVGPFALMQVGAALLLLHLVLYTIVWRRTSAGGATPSASPMKAGNGFALVLRSPYLRRVALFLVLLNLVNTVGEFVLGQMVVGAADARAAGLAGFDKQGFVGQFYGSYFLWVNLATIVLQAFVVARLIRRLGMRGAFLALPVVALGVYGVAAAGAGLVALRWLKTAENSTDYSVMNTAKQMLWLPTTAEEKYKAKQAIDTFFVRAGDLLAAGIVFLGVHGLGFGVRGFSAANVAIVLIAIGVGVALLREYSRLTQAAPARRHAVATFRDEVRTPDARAVTGHA